LITPKLERVLKSSIARNVAATHFLPDTSLGLSQSPHLASAHQRSVKNDAFTLGHFCPHSPWRSYRLARCPVDQNVAFTPKMMRQRCRHVIFDSISLIIRSVSGHFDRITLLQNEPRHRASAPEATRFSSLRLLRQMAQHG